MSNPLRDLDLCATRGVYLPRLTGNHRCTLIREEPPNVDMLVCPPVAMSVRNQPPAVVNFSNRIRHRDDRGRSVGCVLDTVVTGDSIVAALTNIIARALNTKA
jgi:hypothetical protein